MPKDSSVRGVPDASFTLAVRAPMPRCVRFGFVVGGEGDDHGAPPLTTAPHHEGGFPLVYIKTLKCVLRHLSMLYIYILFIYIYSVVVWYCKKNPIISTPCVTTGEKVSRGECVVVCNRPVVSVVD